MARKKKTNKHDLKPGFRREEMQKLIRNRRKTIFFNERECSLIDQYCEKFSVRNKSAFMRSTIIAHILEQLDDNYPRLF